MRILALETSGFSGSLAACRDGQVLRAVDLPERVRTAQSLAPALQDLLQSVGWNPGDVDRLAVTVGPGSFTGLRVGITTAKTFAFAVSAEVVGLDTLEVIAHQVEPVSGRLWTVLDAQRQELFVACFEAAEDGVWRRIGENSIRPAAAWLAGLKGGEQVAGPGLRRWVDQLPEEVQVVPRERWDPQAATVARLAAAIERPDTDFWSLKPAYYRPSAAEEKRG